MIQQEVKQTKITNSTTKNKNNKNNNNNNDNNNGAGLDAADALRRGGIRMGGLLAHHVDWGVKPTCIYIDMCIYIYIEREREID